ncbi:MAG: cupin domain-containing protein [Phycisphaerae bacterium]|nr:cupin domain-containing protein [Phycisphaerae bacterium]
MDTGNIFSDVPADMLDEDVSELLVGSASRVERIVSRGHASPPEGWYDQDEHEWVLLLSGGAEVEFADGETVMLTPGDWVNIPAGTRHRVLWTDEDRDSVWLAVFYRS